MSKKKNVFSNPAFQISGKSQTSFSIAPEINPVRSFFQVKELDPHDRTNIEQILLDFHNPSSEKSDSQLDDDVNQLSQITAEIKTIGKQGLLLIGERVAKARKLLHSYRNGAFVKWLENTFGTRKTGYNMLNYYEFYHSLPEETLKECFKKIPQKAAYYLASREGDLTVKAEIVREYHTLKSEEFIMLIQEKFPGDEADKRRGQTVNKRLIDSLVVAVRKIQKRKDNLSNEDLKAIAAIHSIIDGILSVGVAKSKKSG